MPSQLLLKITLMKTFILELNRYIRVVTVRDNLVDHLHRQKFRNTHAKFSSLLLASLELLLFSQIYFSTTQKSQVVFV